MEFLLLRNSSRNQRAENNRPYNLLPTRWRRHFMDNSNLSMDFTGWKLSQYCTEGSWGSGQETAPQTQFTCVQSLPSSFHHVYQHVQTKSKEHICQTNDIFPKNYLTMKSERMFSELTGTSPSTPRLLSQQSADALAAEHSRGWNSKEQNWWHWF